ncbi:MarR family winged helix-turn-helix transcriptional regulator [Streptomyces purpureus]|nr:MarR family winged helix-turn-helix transcriptional regulator [Streptomyces purpureus]
MPTDWAQVFRTLASADLTIDALTGGPPDDTPDHAPDTNDGSGARSSGPPSLSMTPPSVLDLNAYLMYAIGKGARRRLSDRLTAHNLRLWHLTVLAMVADLGPQMKTVLAARLDMNASDLVKIVNDLVKSDHLACDRDPEDRRRVVVRLTPAGRSFLAHLSADITSTDDDILAPLSAEERVTLASLLRRVHRHLEPAPAGVAGPSTGR